MKNTATIILLLVIGLLSWAADEGLLNLDTSPTIDTGVDPIAAAFRNGSSDVQVQGKGVVTRVLSDDTEGSRHQRFILRLASGQQLLVAHNIDLAPRIHKLSKNETVDFYGEYEWNEKGGVIHWTHHDPGGHHVDGWLKHKGQTYQ